MVLEGYSVCVIEETVQINDQCSSQLESIVKCINMFIMTESSQCSASEALQIVTGRIQVLL